VQNGHSASASATYGHVSDLQVYATNYTLASSAHPLQIGKEEELASHRRAEIGVPKVNYENEKGEILCHATWERAHCRPSPHPFLLGCWAPSETLGFLLLYVTFFFKPLFGFAIKPDQ
jgi:hypothetical protein